MKFWMFLLIAGFSVGIWFGWEIRGKVENNPIVTTQKWFYQFFKGGNNAKSANCSRS